MNYFEQWQYKSAHLDIATCFLLILYHILNTFGNETLKKTEELRIKLIACTNLHLISPRQKQQKKIGLEGHVSRKTDRRGSKPA